MGEFLERLLRWLLSLLGPDEPSPLREFRAEVEMSNVRLSWVLPSVEPRQQPIAHVLIESRVDPSLPWAPVNTVPPPETTLLIEQLAPGTWEFRGIVVDEGGQRSDPLTAVAAIPFDPPSPLVEFTAALE